MGKDISKLRGMNLQELGEEETSLREAIWKLRLQRSTGQLQDAHKVRRTRSDLARVLTVRRERELASDRSARSKK